MGQETAFLDAILLGLAMVLVIEGLAYGVFPDAAKRMMEKMRDVPSDVLRKGGVCALFFGVLCVWLLIG